MLHAALSAVVACALLPPSVLSDQPSLPPTHPSLPYHSRFTALDFVGVITGVAAMGYSPSQRWLDAFAAAVAGHADHISGPHLEAIAAALRRVGYQSSKPQAWIAL